MKIITFEVPEARVGKHCQIGTEEFEVTAIADGMMTLKKIDSDPEIAAGRKVASRLNGDGIDRLAERGEFYD